MEKLIAKVSGNTIQLRGGGWKAQKLDERFYISNDVGDVFVTIEGPSKQHNTTWSCPPKGEDGLIEMDYAAPVSGLYIIHAQQQYPTKTGFGIWGAETEIEVPRG